jgi:sugar-specific transcriptional regulator TrmB
MVIFKKMISELLKKLNFSEKEVEIYLAILKSGKIIPSDLSRITGINRTTVYSILDELDNKKIITRDLSGPVKYVVALPPQDLENIVKEKEKDLQAQKILVHKAIGELTSFASNTKYSLPKIRFIPENELENFLFKQADEWDRSLLRTEPCWYGFQDHTYVENFASNIDWYWSRAHKDIHLKLITNKSDVEKEMKRKEYIKREIKYLKKKVPFTATTWIIGEYIVLIFTNQKPFYAIQIKNAEFANNQRELFKFLWELV